MAATLGVIGECMLEMHSADGARFTLSFGGDVLNTAVYAARLGTGVSFFTGTGDDDFSAWLRASWRAEGVGLDAVRVIPGATPSLYIVSNDAAGERTFHYWREASPFKQWLQPGPYVDGLSARFEALRCVYFSGVTLALLDAASRERLFDLLGGYRARGGLLAFDPNYRPRLWDAAEASRWNDRAYAICDFALPSVEDEAPLRGEASPDELAERIRTLGAREVALKLGEHGSLLVASGERLRVSAAAPRAVVDTTAAGDAFNAGYLSGRLRGQPPRDAAATGHWLASQVVSARGAIVPTMTRTSWPPAGAALVASGKPEERKY